MSVSRLGGQQGAGSHPHAGKVRADRDAQTYAVILLLCRNLAHTDKIQGSSATESLCLFGHLQRCGPGGFVEFVRRTACRTGPPHNNVTSSPFGPAPGVQRHACHRVNKSPMPLALFMACSLIRCAGTRFHQPLVGNLLVRLIRLPCQKERRGSTRTYKARTPSMPQLHKPPLSPPLH